MAIDRRIGGIITLKTNGRARRAKGSFTYNLGAPKREGIVGHDEFHGYKEVPQIAMIEGVITDSGDLNVKNDILNFTDGRVTLDLNNGKTIILREAFYAGEGNITTEEGEIPALFQGSEAEEIAPA